MDDRLLLEGARVRGETIQIGVHKCVDFIFGGTTLDECVLDIRGSGRSFQLFDAVVRNSRIRTRRTLRSHSFTRVHFENCIFEGHFHSCSWGRRPDEEHQYAQVTECDFGAANLHLCRFFGCDAETLRWPGWPNIVVLDPWSHREDWLSIVFPPSLRITQDIVGNAESLGRVSLSDTLAKAIRAEVIDLSSPEYDVEPEKIWPLIQGRQYIVFEGKAARPRVEADLAAIAAENERAAAEADSRLRHLRFWRLLHRGKIVAVEREDPRTVRLRVNTSFLRAKESSAPELVIVELRECDEFRILEGDSEVLTLDKALTLRGADWRGDEVLIMAFGKRRIVAKYRSWQLHVGDGTILAEEDLERIVARYYGS